MSAESSIDPSPAPGGPAARKHSLVDRFLQTVERVGNRLPDPVLLFVIALLMTWSASRWLAPIDFAEIDPRTKAPLRVHDQTTLGAQVSFMTQMVKNFTDFPPLGLVLVALLGVAVAEHAGLISAGVRAMLAVTPPRLLTPALMFVAILSHAAGDTGFVVVIPLGGALFAAAGRPPLAGLACAFAGVSAGFSANFIPSSLDTLLGGITQDAARITTDGRIVNPLCNWYFMAASSVLLLGLGWFVTEKVVEPRLVREGRIENGEEAGLAPLSPAE
ncbi:MAG TPA: AbgT family transporter, partial [Planctomycetia bacterium]|nr:AbgT family transporter [Planctomycetia bacterium]